MSIGTRLYDLVSLVSCIACIRSFMLYVILIIEFSGKVSIMQIIAVHNILFFDSQDS